MNRRKFLGGLGKLLPAALLGGMLLDSAEKPKKAYATSEVVQGKIGGEEIQKGKPAQLVYHVPMVAVSSANDASTATITYTYIGESGEMEQRTEELHNKIITVNSNGNVFVQATSPKLDWQAYITV